MQTHDQLVAKLMRRPGVRKEVERIEREEGELLDILLKARHDAGLTQAQVAERMGTQPPAVARLEGSQGQGFHYHILICNGNASSTNTTRWCTPRPRWVARPRYWNT